MENPTINQPRPTTGELTPEQVERLLYNQAYGRLACTDGNLPYIVPVTYAFDGKYIYGQTNEGTKLDLSRKNPHVCFEVDNMVGMRDWQCVIIHGVFEELEGEAAEAARKILFTRVFPMLSNNMIHAFEHEVTTSLDDATRTRTNMYRIRIEKISGRFQQSAGVSH